jgi:L-fucose isomerase-like protein
LPAACSVGSIWDLDGLKARLGIEIKTVSYHELSGEMETVLQDASARQSAEQGAEQLVKDADRSFIERPYVERSLLFYRTVRNLMARHGCNAFTIECFEFCSSRLPDRWQITPCLIHSLQRDLGHASSCEGDLGSLLAMRMLMSVAGRSCHQGNSDPRTAEAFRINHSVPALKMNGYAQPDLPYQLGRFVTKGWGTKMVVDFMQQAEKTVTVARVDPSATKLLVLRGELVGGSGWDEDSIGCSVEALIRPPQGRLDEFLRKRLEYGNHLQWVYGDWTAEIQQLGEMLGLQVETIA